MRPLKAELDDLEGAEGRLGELFASAEGYRRNPVRKRRIKAMVLAGARERRRRPLGTALAAALLIAGTATAATLGHQLLSGAEEPALAQLPSPPVVHAPASFPKLGATKPTAEVELEPPPESETTEATPRAPRSAKAQPKPVVFKPQAQAPVASKPLADGEDPTRVVEAIRALRQQGNAKKAQTLLNDYMKKNPNGSLSEEALALSIEAAHARNDSKAKVYARRYLARFPNGRHRAFAGRVLGE